MYSPAEKIRHILPFGITGRVSSIEGQCLVVKGFAAPIGSLCEVAASFGGRIKSEVIGFRGEETLLMAYTDLSSVNRAAAVHLIQNVRSVRTGESLLGRIVNSHAIPIDNGPPVKPILTADCHSIESHVVPLTKRGEMQRYETGIRAVDGLFPFCVGHRVGLFGSRGLGKLRLMARLARSRSSEVNVFVFPGASSRQVREFLEQELDTETFRRSVVIVSSVDDPTILHVRSMQTAVSISQAFCHAGETVSLFVNSVTGLRTAIAQLESARTGMESVPSRVSGVLSGLIEMTVHQGDRLTAFFAVDEQKDEVELVDSIQSQCDVSLVLDNQQPKIDWPPIDVLASSSRSLNSLTSAAHQDLARQFKQMIAGSSDTIGRDQSSRSDAWEFLKQPISEFSSYDETLRRLNHAVTGSIANPAISTAS